MSRFPIIKIVLALALSLAWSNTSSGSDASCDFVDRTPFVATESFKITNYLNTDRADVLNAAADGFTTKSTLIISASPNEVYRHFVAGVGRWWDPEHTFSGKAQNMTIEDKINGCFCEKLDGGGDVRHMIVIFREPGKTLRMMGALGPLQELGVSGSLTVSLSKADNGTKMEVTYAVGGYRPGGLQSLAPLVDKVLLQQLARFKKYVEKGVIN